MYAIYLELTRKSYELQIPSNAELPIYHASNTCTRTELQYICTYKQYIQFTPSIPRKHNTGL